MKRLGGAACGGRRRRRGGGEEHLKGEERRLKTIEKQRSNRTTTSTAKKLAKTPHKASRCPKKEQGSRPSWRGPGQRGAMIRRPHQEQEQEQEQQQRRTQTRAQMQHPQKQPRHLMGYQKTAMRRQRETRRDSKTQKVARMQGATSRYRKPRNKECLTNWKIHRSAMIQAELTTMLGKMVHPHLRKSHRSTHLLPKTRMMLDVR